MRAPRRYELAPLRCQAIGCGLIQDLERVVGFAQPEQRVAEERKDEWRVALGDERQLPRADRFLIAAACRVAGSEVEGSREELGVEAKCLAKLRRRRFELAAWNRAPGRSGMPMTRTARSCQRLDRIVEAPGTRVLDYRLRIRIRLEHRRSVARRRIRRPAASRRTRARNARYAMPRELSPSWRRRHARSQRHGFALLAAAAMRPTRNGRMT